MNHESGIRFRGARGGGAPVATQPGRLVLACVTVWLVLAGEASAR